MIDDIVLPIFIEKYSDAYFKQIKETYGTAHVYFCSHNGMTWDCMDCMGIKDRFLQEERSFGTGPLPIEPGGMRPSEPIIPKPIITEIKIEPYKRGMELDGGFKLYGNKSTAILRDPFADMDIHHHTYGGGRVYIGKDPLIDLSWKINEKNK